MSPDLLRGHTDTIILGLLLEDDKYCFDICNMIHDLTDGEYRPKESTVYSCCKRLETKDYISSHWGDGQSGRRRYYHIEDKGRTLFEQNKLDWIFTNEILYKLLRG